MKRNDPRRLRRRQDRHIEENAPERQTGPQTEPQSQINQPAAGQHPAGQPKSAQAGAEQPANRRATAQSAAAPMPKQAKIGITFNLLRIFLTAAVVATIFTSFTPLGLTFGLGDGLDDIFQPPSNSDNIYFPTPTNRPLPKIGIVAGHYGIENDTGAICPDGLTEVSINLDIAARVQQILREEGYDVDLLKENDERLDMYSAIALVSIHADTCGFYGEDATGFKIASSVASTESNKSERLVNCIYSRYQDATGLPYHEGVTADMTEYHAFEEINQDTAAVIIETGFMLLDRQILTQQPNLVAQGIADGVLCYIYNEDASQVGEPLP